jgi:PAS domain S-box-containing protein
MSDIFNGHSKERRWLGVAPFVAVLAILLIEIETPGLRVAPSLLTIALAIFALFLSPRAVFWWAAVFFVPVVLTLAFIPNNGVGESAPFIALRSLAFVAVAWVGVILSRYRWDSERRLEGLLALFDSLKTPILVSDNDGNINFANRACCELLDRGAEEIKDTNFFSVFSQPDQRGQSIERYLKLFEKDVNQSSLMTVSIQKNASEMTRTANCFTLKWDKQKFLVTQIG